MPNSVDDENILHRARLNYDEGGLVQLIKEGIPYTYRNSLRRVLPKHGYVRKNGVKVSEKKLFDDQLPYSFHTNDVDDPNFEGGIVSLHRHITEPGDTVGIIAGGYGVSAIHATRQVGNHGHVEVYEASDRQLEILKSVVQRYNLEEQVTIHHAVVGPSIHIYSDHEKASHTPTEELPEVDVLELDCEGAEFEIIHDLEIRPRALIIEIHPHRFEHNPWEIIETVETEGYTITHQLGHDGAQLSNEELKEMFELNRSDGQNQLPSGAKHPPVIAAEL